MYVIQNVILTAVCLYLPNSLFKMKTRNIKRVQLIYETKNIFQMLLENN